ncbi:hypothetical protein HELRODRAFT_171635 [Helobdella robusta]|uniref:Uncharacterized protein n=1 Tax=Helobdella robusta TaxID=6412 RepID=T1F4H5_HELRO|nr:hypothetical protein HELRODRAFT_171635 [Helobdella robusta]ESO05276.1 hypothetical protein HELRODRAFT_171635 [Helobdella robusta]
MKTSAVLFGSNSNNELMSNDDDNYALNDGDGEDDDSYGDVRSDEEDDVEDVEEDEEEEGSGKWKYAKANFKSKGPFKALLDSTCHIRQKDIIHMLVIVGDLCISVTGHFITTLLATFIK